MNNSTVIAIQSFVITTIIYALLVPVFFQMGNPFGEKEYFVDVDDDKDQITMSTQQLVDTKCKSPCPSSAEMCIAMCA